MTAETVGVAIIGCGGAAALFHAPGFKRLEEAGQCRLLACCDVVPGAAAQFAERFGIPRAFEDYRDLLALEEVDAVSVVTPPFAHAEPTVAALRAGKHVLCEKPMAMNAAEGAAMLAAARQAGKVLTIGYGWRFTAEAQAIHGRLAAGDLGEIYYGKAAALRRRGVPAWGGLTQKRVNGGGPLIDIGVHQLDLALWLMGSPRPVAASGATFDCLAHRPGMPAQNRLGAAGPYDPSRFDVEDLCAGFVRFANGACLFLETSWLLDQEADEIHRVEVYGTAGHACTDPFQILVDDGNALSNVTPPENEVPRHATDFNFLRMEHFVACALGRAQPLVRAEEALDVQRMVDALYQSAGAGHEVEIGS